jgi:hypothetical protein
VVERWNGTSWAVEPTVTYPGSTTIEPRLSGISCATASSCVGVSAYGEQIGTGPEGPVVVAKPLAVTWNGTSWSMTKLPSPPYSGDTTLSSVSCTSSTSCFAVGMWMFGQVGQTLVEHWNGTSWSVVSSPNRFNATNNHLSSVSCLSDSNCFAAGGARIAPFDVTLVERYS